MSPWKAQKVDRTSMAVAVPAPLPFGVVCPIPGLEGFFLVWDGGLAITLPPEDALTKVVQLAYRNNPLAGKWECQCGRCSPEEPLWDTLRVHPNHMEPWRVHWPELRKSGQVWPDPS